MVDDDYIVADDVSRALDDQGASVLGPVPSVTEALALLARGDRPDMALLDVKLGEELVYPLVSRCKRPV